MKMKFKKTYYLSGRIIFYIMRYRYKALYGGGEGEFTEKKSRFIATTCPVDSEEEALTFIESIKKKYWNATHNCSAYVIGKRHELQRCSDDGEPNGTAGRPMLDVLLGEDVHNIAVVVTRYFGGTLLGTGGLVRAYSGAVKIGLENSMIVEKHLGIRLQVQTDYNGIGKIQYITAQADILTLNTEYTDIVTIELLVPVDEKERLRKKITEATSGRAKLEILEETWFGQVNEKIILFKD